jgi:hypothetical protein
MSYAIEEHTGDLSWSSEERDRNRVIAILDDPSRQQQWVGVSIQHTTTGAHAHLLFHPGREAITVSPTDTGRALVANTEITDLPWYLETMLPSLHAVGLMGYTMKEIAK